MLFCIKVIVNSIMDCRDYFFCFFTKMDLMFFGDFMCFDNFLNDQFFFDAKTLVPDGCCMCQALRTFYLNYETIAVCFLFVRFLQNYCVSIHIRSFVRTFVSSI